MSKYRRITPEDRCQIYALNKRGSSQQGISELLGISQSAVSRELRRNRGKRGYRFKQAQAKAEARRAVHGKPRKLTASVRLMRTLYSFIGIVTSSRQSHDRLINFVTAGI